MFFELQRGWVGKLEYLCSVESHTAQIILDMHTANSRVENSP